MIKLIFKNKKKFRNMFNKFISIKHFYLQNNNEIN